MSKQGITSAPWLRGTSGPGRVAKAWRGKEGYKEAQKLKLKVKPKDKTHVKEQRDISGQKVEVSYTKSRWKSWKKGKKDQFKRKENYLKTIFSK